MINITDKKNCCGCTACSSICPKNCIEMQSDFEGFLYPAVNQDLCIDCGMCERVCPVLNAPELPTEYKDCVVAQSTETDVLSESTSGGFIDALNKHVLENLNGYSVGVLYNDEFLPEHIIKDNYTEAIKFRNSKYAQSSLDGIFKNIKGLLQDNKLVMFTGTPCQVAGLKNYLNEDYSNLITVDIVCRSIPSPKLWREYLDWQESKNKSKIQSVFCRKKTYGYHSGALEIEFENKKHYAGSNRVDYYMKLFHSDVCSRPSCYDCKFKTEHRCSDFTVFDCWSPEKVTSEPLTDNDKGYSNVLVHTEKGKALLYEIPDTVLTKADAEKMFEFTGGMEANSIELTEKRQNFYKDLEADGFISTAKKYVSVSTTDNIIEALKPLRYRIKK